MQLVINFCLLYFIYSFLGWIMEVIFIRITTKKWINRGFLISPICPIYGCGCLLLISLLSWYDNDLFAIFLGSVFICSLLEYFTSYFLEKIFKARWWDYSQYRYNINGRICLETMLPFGLFGTLIVGFVDPFFLEVLDKISFEFKVTIAIIFIFLHISDLIISFKTVSSIKGKVNGLEGDNTEEIKIQIKKLISGSYFARRLLKAFPHLLQKIVRFNINDLNLFARIRK